MGIVRPSCKAGQPTSLRRPRPIDGPAGAVAESAADTYRRLGLIVDLAFVGIGRAMLTRPLDAVATAAAAEAREILTRLRATPLLDLSDAALAPAIAAPPSAAGLAQPGEASSAKR